MYSSPVNLYKSASEVRWYLSTDVIDYLYKLRDFILFTPCKLSGTMIPRLHATPSNLLFGPYYRFPESRLFICEGIGNWNSRLQEIQLLNSIITNSNRLQRKYKNINTMADAEVTLLNCINDAIQEYESGIDLFDRVEFEQRYELTWEEDENDIHHDDHHHHAKRTCRQKPKFHPKQKQKQPATTTTTTDDAPSTSATTAPEPVPVASQAVKEQQGLFAQGFQRLSSQINPRSTSHY